MCMSHHYNRNRQIVQQKLELRKEQRIEAAQDAAERRFYEEINTHSKTHLKEIADAQAVQRRHAAQKAAHARQKKAYRDRENRLWGKFLQNTFGSLLFAVLLTALGTNGTLPLWMAIPPVIVACAYSVHCFIGYIKRKGAKA